MLNHFKHTDFSLCRSTGSCWWRGYLFCSVSVRPCAHALAPCSSPTGFHLWGSVFTCVPKVLQCFSQELGRDLPRTTCCVDILGLFSLNSVAGINSNPDPSEGWPVIVSYWGDLVETQKEKSELQSHFPVQAGRFLSVHHARAKLSKSSLLGRSSNPIFCFQVGIQT